MNLCRPSLSPQWTEAVLAELATLGAEPSPSAIEALSARLGACAFPAHAPRAATSEPAGYRRHLLCGGSAAARSCLLIEWPAAHATPIHDHAGLWGIELVLDGALEVEEFALDGEAESPGLTRMRTLLLGAGDSAWFTGGRYAHRCRNLSASRPALSLHVYGGTLEHYRAFQPHPGGGHRLQAQRARIDTTLSI